MEKILKIFNDKIQWLKKIWRKWKYRKCKKCPLVDMKLVKLNDSERESVIEKMRELHE